MQHNELMEKANVSRSTFYKLKNGENVTTDILLRICDALDCDISEIMECIKNDLNNKWRMHRRIEEVRLIYG